MQQGVDYNQSYSPIAKDDSICMCLCIGASQGMSAYIIDTVNAFQTQVESNPAKRQYITLPPCYLQFFQRTFQHIKLPSDDPKKLCMQTQTSWQGCTDAGNKWYSLLRPVIKEAGFIVCQADKGVLSKQVGDSRAMLCLSTDEVLLLAKTRNTYLELMAHLKKFFAITSSEGPIL